MARIHEREGPASMRLGRERPRKPAARRPGILVRARFNEAGARTPQKDNCCCKKAYNKVASMRLGRERPRKHARRVEAGLPARRFNEAGARTPQKDGYTLHGGL